MNEVVPPAEVSQQTEPGKDRVEPTLKLKFLSHGTLESKDARTQGSLEHGRPAEPYATRPHDDTICLIK